MPNVIGEHGAGFGAKREKEEGYRARVGIIGESACCLLCRARHKRHTFAVHRVTEWYRQGADVQKLLPALSTYLGHISLESTQRYLTITPELLQRANNRFERYAKGGAQ